MSSIINKVKEAVHPQQKTSEVPEGMAGPHSSGVANAADPRVDSDRDHRRAPESTLSSGNPQQYTSSNNYSHGTATTTPGMTTTGGQVPRSDLDEFGMTGSQRDGAPGANYSSGTGTGVPGTGMHSTTGTTGTGTHHGLGTGTHHTGLPGTHHTTGTGMHSTTGTTGTHTTGVPGTHHTIGTTGTGTHHGLSSGTHNTTTTGTRHAAPAGATESLSTGPAHHTAGPHQSDLANKLDPRVDSNLDGSKTMGGNTRSTGTTRDPTDAAQAPPSVMRHHLGDPIIEHGDHSHQRDRRNSVATAQETDGAL